MPTPVFFYAASIEQLLKQPSASSRLLNSEEGARYRRMKSKRNANQMLAGRWLIQKVLERQFAIPMGEPYQIEDFRVWHHLASGRRFSLSLSHSKDRVALLVSEATLSLGIDVEYGKTREFAELLPQVAAPDEQQAFLKSDFPKDYFYQLWTTKEAWFKMSALPMHELFCTSFQPLYGADGNTRWQRQDYFYRHYQEDNYYYSICYKQNVVGDALLKVSDLVESNCTFL